MTDPWDIARYLEEHPEDHEQRWRLAKKLYASWEYRHALEHLNILKNEWKRHLNVNRYLAATLYRLGRYEEAAKELREAIFEWPGEIAIYEQLARVLEAAGSKEDAISVWEEVLELDPNHATAKSAAKRLREKEEEGAGSDLRIIDSDNGELIESGIACPNCGAQNSPEFELCWQCHAPLGNNNPQHNPTPYPSPAAQPEKQSIPREQLNLFLGFLTVTVITVSVYLSLKLLSASDKTMPDDPVTFGALLNYGLAISRVLTGAGIALLWPALLIIGVWLSRPQKSVSASRLFSTGLFLAGTCYLLTWLPGGLAILSLPAAVLLSLAALLVLITEERKKALIAWVVQISLLFILAPMIFGIVEAKRLGQFFNPYSSIPSIIELASTDNSAPQTRPPLVEEAELPIEFNVTWTAADSAWLTRRANHVVCIIDYSPTTAATPPKFEVVGPNGTQVYSDIELPGSRQPFTIQPGTAYTFILNGPTNVRATLRLESLLDYEVTQRSKE